MLTSYKEYLEYLSPINIFKISLLSKDILNPEDVSKIYINNWSIYTYVKIDNNIQKFKNLQTFNINYYEISDIELLFYLFDIVQNIQSTFIIDDMAITVKILKNNDKPNYILLRQGKYGGKNRYINNSTNFALEKLLKNLPLVDVLAITLEYDAKFYVNVPATVKTIYFNWYYQNFVKNIKMPFDCLIYYKYDCCVDSILNC